MRLLISILLNSIILYLFVYFLGKDIVILDCNCDIKSIFAIKTYIMFGIFIAVFNVFIGYIIRNLNTSLYALLSLGLIVFVDSLLFGFLNYFLNDILQIEGIGYTINGWRNFVIIVAILSILNMFYSLLFFKLKD